MINWFERHFIPNEENDFRPEFLVGKNVKQLTGALVVIELVIFILPTLFFAQFVQGLHLSAVLPGVLATLTNEERAKQNLTTLVENPVLMQAAQLKAQDMAQKSYFAHTSPEGKTPWYWFKQAGYRYSIAGENLAVSFSDSKEVTQAWMNSPSHRANIVRFNFKEMGTGVAVGTYKGRESIFVAQVYASPQGGALIQGNIAEVPSTLDLALTSPHRSMSAVLFVFLCIVVGALFLNIFIKLDRQHPDLIRNGFFAILIVLVLSFANRYIAEDNFETSFTTFDSTTLDSEAGE